MRKVVVLTSAGIESASLCGYYLSKGFRIYPLYVKTGQRWERIEMEKVKVLTDFLRHRFKRVAPLRITSFPTFSTGPFQKPKEEKDIEIPLRNLTLLTVGILFALKKGADAVAVGSLGMYDFPDNREEFFKEVESLTRKFSSLKIDIETPFMGMEKHEVIKTFHRTVPLGLTFSCADPVRDMHCGVCVKCRERKEGFQRAGVEDPTSYYFQ